MQWNEIVSRDNPDYWTVRGSKLGIDIILNIYLSGDSPELIESEYEGSFSLAQVEGVIAYYLSHRDEVDAYLKRLKDDADKRYQEYLAREPSPVEKRMRAILADPLKRAEILAKNLAERTVSIPATSEPSKPAETVQ